MRGTEHAPPETFDDVLTLSCFHSHLEKAALSLFLKGDDERVQGYLAD